MNVRAPATARSRQTRADLAGATHDELAYHGTLNVDAVAKAAGVSTATFYSHFATHDDAIATALDISLASVVDVAVRLFHIEALIEAGLSKVIDDLVVAMHKVFSDESLVMRVALARLPVHQPIRDIYRLHEARSLEHITRQIQLGQKAGILRSGNHQQRAITLLVLLQGLHNPLLTKKRIDGVVATDLHRAIQAVLSQD